MAVRNRADKTTAIMIITTKTVLSESKMFLVSISYVKE